MNTQFDAIVQAVIHDWPDYGWSGQLAVAIEHLYRTGLTFPPTWPSDRCEEFIATHADNDATFLTTTLDDLVDIVTDLYMREFGIFPHRDDAELLIAAARREALDELEVRLTVELPAEISALAAHSLGRVDRSMTACGSAQRQQRPRLRRRTEW